MDDVAPNVDINATMANHRVKKGAHPYATDKHLRNTLESVITGSIRAGDRLHAADMIDTDKCPHCNDGTRHTTKHMFWSCERHRKCREKAVKEMHNIFNNTAQKHGPMARQHLADVLENNAFQHAGICPEDTKALAKHKQVTTKDEIFSEIPESEKS